ncbi:MAG: NUDIX domain-containing protein [Nocardioidaceae bacterium]
MVDSKLLEILVARADADGIQQLVVGGVVQQENTVLLLRRPDSDFMGGIFELPSGKVEVGERLDSALIREVKEETDLDVSAIRDFLGSFDYRSGSGKRSRQFNFALEVSTPGPVRLHEHDDYVWVSIDDEPPVTDAVKVVIQKYLECPREDSNL